MSDDSTTECLLFPGIFRKPVVAQFDQREGSSDGGALLLKAADGHYGLLEELTACLRDQRQAGKVDHSLRELVGTAGILDCLWLSRTATTPPDWAATPFISCFWSRSGRRSRPGLATDSCRVSRMGSESRNCIAWVRLWPAASSGGTPSDYGAGLSGHDRSGSHR